MFEISGMSSTAPYYVGPYWGEQSYAPAHAVRCCHCPELIAMCPHMFGSREAAWPLCARCFLLALRREPQIYEHADAPVTAAIVHGLAELVRRRYWRQRIADN